MTVIACRYENAGSDIVVLADHRRTSRNLATGEMGIVASDILKSVALSDDACVAVAGGVVVTDPLLCYVAGREDWLERCCEEEFQPAREIEALPERIGIGIEEARKRIEKHLPVLFRRAESGFRQFREANALRDVGAYLAGSDGKRLVIYGWSASHELKRQEYLPGGGGVIHWPIAQYGRASLAEFSRKLSGALPIGIRARAAFRYAGSLGPYVSPSFSIRKLSGGFDLCEEGL